MNYSFLKQNKKAKEYEKLFFLIYNKIIKNQEMKWLNLEYLADYKIGGKYAEIKIDFTTYSNFYFERESNSTSGRLGGPWGAKKYPAKWYLYWFVNPNNPNYFTCFSFENDKLVDWLDKNILNYKLKYVKNDGYSSMGIAVPIIDVISIAKVKNLKKEAIEWKS